MIDDMHCVFKVQYKSINSLFMPSCINIHRDYRGNLHLLGTSDEVLDLDRNA